MKKLTTFCTCFILVAMLCACEPKVDDTVSEPPQESSSSELTASSESLSESESEPESEPSESSEESSEAVSQSDVAKNADVLTYLDKENMIELNYPDVFAVENSSADSGANFESLQDGVLYLSYWVADEATELPKEGDSSRIMDSVDLGNGSTAAMGETIAPLSPEIGYGYYVCLWVIDSEKYFDFIDMDKYPNIIIMCETPEEAEKWYASIKEGAVYLNSADGLDIE